MAIVDLGKITFVNKGAWNKATNYEIKDIISYNQRKFLGKPEKRKHRQ